MVADRLDFETFTLVYLSNPETGFELELTINKDRTEAYALGDGYGHLALSVDDLDAEHARFSDLGFNPGKLVDFKPGGEVILVNHFSQVEGVRGWVERRMAPFADLIGWRSVFDQSRVMVCDELELAERRALRPWGIFTMLRFSKRADARLEAAE